MKKYTIVNYDKLKDIQDIRCINTIRVLSADIVQKANSGHPGAPMGCAPIAHLLWSEIMVYNAGNPKWINRDRFILSNGHASALLYSMLHLSGYAISMDELKNFRQKGSITPGHPESLITPGVEVTTGPLGQGISNGVGIAIGEVHLRHTYERDGFSPINHYTYILCGDGCLQEGISAEASSLAGHLGLGRIILIYDDNHVTIDGDISLSFTEDVNKRYEAYGWHVQTVADVNDISALRNAIKNARDEEHRPSFIKVRTIIGYGSAKQGTGLVHGTPLGVEDVINVKKLYNFDQTKFFFISDDVKNVYINHGLVKGAAVEEQWNKHFKTYTFKHSKLAAELLKRFTHELPPLEKILSAMPKYSIQDKVITTRECAGKVLNVIASLMPDIIGGTADLTPDIFSISLNNESEDLTPSMLAVIKCSGDFQANNRLCRYIHFGVREHAMGGICNGLFAYGAFRPFCGTYLVFVEYMISAVRLAALSRFGVIFIFTRDSINIGEDGPTHQPIETLETLRSFPNLFTFRPADGNETIGCYLEALKHTHTPSIMALSFQQCPELKNSNINKVSLGGYIIHETNNIEDPLSLVIISTGTEVNLSIQVADTIISKYSNLHIRVRVVSMPCTQLFDQQPLEYQLEMLPNGIPVMSIEMATSSFWLRYAHATIGIDSYGFSAPVERLLDYFGFTVPKLVNNAYDVLNFYKDRYIESKLIRPRFTHIPSLN